MRDEASSVRGCGGARLGDIARRDDGPSRIAAGASRGQSGPADAFQETYPHDGDVDMLRAMRVYREVGYPYLVMPDHVPSHEDDPGGTQAFAFCYGRPSPRAHFS
ncbi:MAG: hypothetical protein AMK72_06150 [Planctomycetes bacterium SM23_25]|nr:MAG: hypothetical protein AMK72_06150 [Planctomycetes bacterium SM23_25]